MTTTTYPIPSPSGTDLVDLRVTETGSGHPVLLLHGGAGPASVAGFATLLADAFPTRVVVPTHPGFDGTDRPADLTSPADLAALYVTLLDHLGLVDVTVVGNSLGGWVAAEIALAHSPRVSSVVLVDAVGLTSDSEPIVDFFALTMDEIVDLNYHASHREAARAAQQALPDAVREAMAGNRSALLAYGGESMADPGLAGRLPSVAVPTLVVWGAADRIVAPGHGRAYADSIPGATLRIIDDAGHLPQIETPDALAATIWEFADRHATARPV
ncbi:alpha/beta hydrolase [uncultured Williamsia sp.]|uniref:alpha/beta fold hydrolase n=1 Tax=uncultured Williamsia sp. TaxID=259311 RepID=UPI0026293EFF|nr:alpha/beta hydrolase [uncultured Williamsia sp.]